jgi:hypothetical protein
MRICHKKFSSLKAEAGVSDAALSRVVGYAHRAGLAYHVSKIKKRKSIAESNVFAILNAFSMLIDRKVDIRELVMTSDLPRESRRKQRTERDAV